MELINCQKKVITIDGLPYTFLKKAYGKFDLQPLINLKLSSALNIYAQWVDKHTHHNNIVTSVIIWNSKTYTVKYFCIIYHKLYVTS